MSHPTQGGPHTTVRKGLPTYVDSRGQRTEAKIRPGAKGGPFKPQKRPLPNPKRKGGPKKGPTLERDPLEEELGNPGPTKKGKSKRSRGDLNGKERKK